MENGGCSQKAENISTTPLLKNLNMAIKFFQICETAMNTQLFTILFVRTWTSTLPVTTAFTAKKIITNKEEMTGVSKDTKCS